MGQTLAEIIVIDDDPHFLEYLETLLMRWGYKVWAFHKAKEALERLYQFPPQLLITDFYMPDLNGIEVLKAVKDSAKSPPVIGLSGKHERDRLDLMRQLGAAAVFQKPLDPKKLGAEILRIIERPPRPVVIE